MEVAFIRDGQSAGRFLKWLIRVALNGSRRLLGTILHVRLTGAASTPLPARQPSAVPVTVAALGPLAQTVLPEASGVVNGLPGQEVDVVLADTRNEAQGIPFPAVVLSENIPLAVPAVNPHKHNPIGWPPRFKEHVAALGPLDRLPTGAHADLVAKKTDFELIRHCHHLEDIGAFHGNAIDRAGTLVGLAATGVPIHIVDDDAKLNELLGDELYGLFKTDIRGASPLTRELHSIRTRRIALRDHSSDGRIRQVCKVASVDLPRLPSVSVLLATNRPKFIGWALENVAKQSYPQLQLILALHGEHFDDEAVNRAAAQLTCPFEVTRVSSQDPFSVVLNVASQAASGTILTKMDDDDLYDADHVWDLVLAREYSRAHLVGKGAQVIYLQGSDQTLERGSTQTERYSSNVAGGTLMIARDDLASIGGWRSTPPNVDRTLIGSVVRDGGAVYRTHGRGYILIRHGGQHAWNPGDQYLLDAAKSVHSGWRSSLGGFDVPAPDFIHTT